MIAKTTVITTLFLLIFSILATNINAQNDSEHFLYIISNNRLIENSDNLVLDKQFVIFHNYDKLYIRYYKDNITYYEDIVYKKVIVFTLHDNAYLIIKHNNKTIVNAIVHKHTLINTFKYSLNMKYDNIIISSLTAFFSALFIVVSMFYYRERRVV